MHTFEKGVPPSSLQKQPGYGYGDAEAELRKHGIESTNRAFGLDFDKFKTEALANLAAGSFPATVIPSYVYYDESTESMTMMNHAYIVCENQGKLEFVTWSLRSNSMEVWTEDRFRKMNQCWANTAVDQADHQLHTLFPRVAASQKEAAPSPQSAQNPPA